MIVFCEESLYVIEVCRQNTAVGKQIVVIHSELPWCKVNPLTPKGGTCITIRAICQNQAGNQLISCLIYLFSQLILDKIIW